MTIQLSPCQKVPRWGKVQFESWSGGRVFKTLLGLPGGGVVRACVRKHYLSGFFSVDVEASVKTEKEIIEDLIFYNYKENVSLQNFSKILKAKWIRYRDIWCHPHLKSEKHLSDILRKHF